MKSNSGLLGSVVLMILLAFCLILIANETWASEAEVVPDDGKVEVIYPANVAAPYRERRGHWSKIFAISMDQILPDKFRSEVTDESYEELFGSSPVKLVQAQIGVKYNFALGGIGASALYGMGSVEDGRGQAGPANKLDLTKFGGNLNFVMDNLFPEPYVAPYIEGQFFAFDWKESRNDGSSSKGQTAFTSALTFGLLFQLNWLDPSSSKQALDSAGLENVFIDLFVSQYNTSESEDDPNFQTGVNYGAGLRFEF